MVRRCLSLPPIAAPLAALLLVAGASGAWGDAPRPDHTAREAALQRLASPLLHERRQAERALVQMLPEVRPALIEALPRSTWGVQVHLLAVLSKDRSPEALEALLGHLVRAEPTQAALIQQQLARDPEVAARLLATWRRAPAAFLRRGAQHAGGASRLEALVRLLRRAEIEERFLSRKSKSGSTGYYRGQYDLLKGEGLEPDYREHALQVVTGIALDRALASPGVYTSGVYQFLRVHAVDEWELKAMALNAVGELCTPDDLGVLARLEQRRQDLLVEREEAYDRMRSRYYGAGGAWDDKIFQDAMQEWEDLYGEGLDVLACLYQVRPGLYGRLVRQAVDDLESMRGIFVPLSRRSYIAALLIRVGWYQEAIDAYQSAMFGGRSSKALGYYNMACAAASASRQEDLPEGDRKRRLDEAMLYLWESVEAGWSDLDWMNEDRDLDPLREHRRSSYDHLVERLKTKWHAAEEPPK